MKKLFTVLMIILMGAEVCLAQNKKPIKDEFHVLIFLKNDSVAEGYLRNYLGHVGIYYKPQIMVTDSTMNIVPDPRKLKLFGKNTIKYKTCDIDSMLTWYDHMPELKMKWVPSPAILSYGNDEPVITYYYPVMLLEVFKGKHVSGYTTYDAMGDRRWFYKTPDMHSANVFIRAGGKITDKRRKTLLEEFGEYPEMVEYIESLKKDDLREDPMVLIKKFDEVLGK